MVSLSWMVSSAPPHSIHQRRQPDSPALKSRQRGIFVMSERAKLGADKLQPGIPVEVHITTEERTALSYLVKPMADQINRAFRER